MMEPDHRSIENGLAHWIKSNRAAQELSQRELAHRAAISRSYLCDIEHGRGTQPSISVLEKLATALGASSAEILRAAGILHEGFDSDDHSGEYKLLSLYRDLSENGRIAVERFARFVHVEEQRWIQPRLIDGQSERRPPPSPALPGLFGDPEPTTARGKQSPPEGI